MKDRFKAKLGWSVSLELPRGISTECADAQSEKNQPPLPNVVGNRHRSLLKNLRYAIPIIFIAAAVVTLLRMSKP